MDSNSREEASSAHSKADAHPDGDARPDAGSPSNSQTRMTAGLNKLRSLSGNTKVILALVLLCAYVLLGIPPFDAKNYNKQGQAQDSQRYGSSSESPFAIF